MLSYIKTGLIIIGVYFIIVLYLLFASYRVDALDNNNNNNNNTSIPVVKLNNN